MDTGMVGFSGGLASLIGIFEVASFGCLLCASTLLTFNPDLGQDRHKEQDGLITCIINMNSLQANPSRSETFRGTLCTGH